MIQVTTNNRAACRKFLAMLPAWSGRTAQLATLKLSHLQEAMLNAWNGDVFSDEQRAVWDSIAEGTFSAPEPEPEQAQEAQPLHAASFTNKIAAKAFQTIINEIAQAAVNADTVRTIVAEELARLAPRTIEITCEGSLVRMEERTHKLFDDCVRLLGTRVNGRRRHVLLLGPAGSGKSTLGPQCAKALGIPYYSTGAVGNAYALFGYVSPNGDRATLRTPLRCAVEDGGLFNLDDIDGSNPNALIPLAEGLANGKWSFPDGMVEQHPNFVCLASANTLHGATAEYVGRNKLDEATKSRFGAVLFVDYDEEMEKALVPGHQAWASFVHVVRANIKKEGVKVLATMRHVLDGAAYLEAGFPKERVAELTIFRGLDADVITRLSKGA